MLARRSITSSVQTSQRVTLRLRVAKCLKKVTELWGECGAQLQEFGMQTIHAAPCLCVPPAMPFNSLSSLQDHHRDSLSDLERL